MLASRSAGGERRWWGWRAIGVAGDMRGLVFDLELRLGIGIAVWWWWFGSLVVDVDVGGIGYIL